MLKAVLPKLGREFLGSAPFERYGFELPLLVKLLDTAEWLSVQVHPDDAYAHSVEPDSGFHGKTEAWYLLEGEGEIVYGLGREVDRQTLRQKALDGSIGEILNRVPVCPGDVIYVPAKTIHAIGPGLLLYEVQQRSDLTYRLYDYGRGRELQLEKGLETATLKPSPMPRPAPDGEVLLASEHFVLSRHVFSGARRLEAPTESFLLVSFVSGQCQREGQNLELGETFLVGAGEGLELEGHAVLLSVYVPSTENLMRFPPQTRVG